jgi:hypothetical protein
MRRTNFELDAKSTTYLWTGKTTAVPNFDVDTPPGQPRPQATDQDGTPLWTIDVLVEDENADRAQVAGVRVAAAHQPVFEKFKAVPFIGLSVSVYVNKAGQLGLMYEGRLRQVAEQKSAA